MGVTSTLTEFRPITLPEVTEEDMSNLKKALDSDPLGQSPENVRDSILRGETLFWRYKSDDGSAAILTQEVHGTEAGELFIWYVGGKGIRSNGGYITEVLEEFAKLRGLIKVTSLSSPGMSRFLRKFGYKVAMHYMSKEIN